MTKLINDRLAAFNCVYAGAYKWVSRFAIVSYMSKPYTSALETHVETIRSLRLKKKTWREIAILLSEEHGYKTSYQNCFQFFKRYTKRSAPLGFPERKKGSAIMSETPVATSKPAWMPKPEASPLDEMDFSVMDPTEKFRTNK